jgi:protein phosphatase
MRGKMDCYGLSDAGKVLPVNQDQFLIADLSKSMLIHQSSLSHEDHTRLFSGSQGQLLLVADGVGKHATGKEASALAVEGLAHYVLNTMSWFFQLREDGEDDLAGELRAALGVGQERVEAAASASAEHRRMGTTLTMAYLLWPRLYVVHAGDSRCYLLRGSALEQITTDHTMAQRLMEHGALRPEEVQTSRWSRVLWNCLGGGSHDLTADVYKATLEVGDTLLLCTDGLTKAVGDEQIRRVLTREEGAESACRKLVDLANELGGTDNVTVVVARFLHGEQVRHAEAQAAAEAKAEQRANGAGARAEAPAAV